MKNVQPGIPINLPGAEPIILTEWRYSDLQGYPVSPTWRPLTTPSVSGLQFSAETVTPNAVARYKDGRIALKCTDGFVYLFGYHYQEQPA